MRKQLYFSLLVCSLVGTGFAQKQPGVAWQKSYGGSANDFGVSIAYGSAPFNPMKGYIITGTTLSSNGDVSTNHGAEDIWVLRISREGEKLWEKTYGDGRADLAGHIAPTADGGYIVAGTTWPMFIPPNDTNSLQWWIFKIDSLGTMLWEKKYGGSSPDNLIWMDLTPSGDIYCVGHSTSNNRDFPENKGNYDIWVMKLTATGELIWKRNLGGSAEDRATHIRVTKDGGCILSGRTLSTDGDMADNHGGADGVLAKYDANGNLEWKKVHGTAAAESFNAVIAMANGDYVAVGITQGAFDPNGDFDIIRYDSAGNTIWEKFYGGSGRDEATALLEVQNGVQVLGTSTSVIDSIPTHRGLKDFLVYRLDANGENGSNLFARWFGGTGDDEAGGNLLSAAPGYITVGRSNSSDAFVTDNHGNFDVWVVNYGGGAGLFIPPVLFGQVDTGKTVTQDAVVRNESGETLSLTLQLAIGEQFTMEPDPISFQLGATSDTTITFTFTPTQIGFISDTLIAKPDIGQAQRILLQGIGSEVNAVEDQNLLPVTIFPNPAGDIITISAEDIAGTYILRIENTSGDEVRKFTSRDSLTGQYDIRTLSSGMYVLSIYQNNRLLARQKFVKK